MQCSCSPNSLLLTPLYVHGEVYGYLNHARPETGNLDVVIVGFNNIWKTVPVPQLVPMQNMKGLQEAVRKAYTTNPLVIVIYHHS